MYYPYHQSAASSMRLALRTSGNAGSVTAAVRGVLRDLAPEARLSAVATMDEILARSVSSQKGDHGRPGPLLSRRRRPGGHGIYSVLAYQVAGRRHEIGVRMALGATVDRVANGVVRRGLLLSGVGLLVGIPAAMAATRLIRSSLFGIEPLAPLTHAVVSLLVGIVATGACLLPARRAARVDPVTAFRSD